MSAPSLSFLVLQGSDSSGLSATLASVYGAAEALAAEGEGTEVLLAGFPEPAASQVVRPSSSSALVSLHVLACSSEDTAGRMNEAVQASRAVLLCTVTSGDIVTAGYVRAAIQLLRTAEQPMAVYAEHLVTVGTSTAIWRNERATVDGLSHVDLIRRAAWRGPVMTVRAQQLAQAYRGIGSEPDTGDVSWMWTIDSSAAGMVHRAAIGTACFRIVSRTPSTTASPVTLLPSFDLEGLRRHLPTRAIAAPTADRPPATISGRIKTVTRQTLTRMPPSARGRIVGSARRAKAATAKGLARVNRARDVRRIVDRVTVAEAARTDRRISRAVRRLDPERVQVARDDGYAAVLLRAVDDLSGHSGALIIVPWLDTGDAGRAALDYAKAIDSAPGWSGRVAILGTDDPARTTHDVIPGSIRYVDLDPRSHGWLPEHREVLLAQVIGMLAPEVTLAAADSLLAGTLTRRTPASSMSTRVFLTVFDFDDPLPHADRRRRAPFADALAVADHVIVDSAAAARRLSADHASAAASVVVHRHPCSTRTTELARATRAYQNEHFTPRNPFRVLAPEPPTDATEDARGAIAAEIARRGMPVEIVALNARSDAAHTAADAWARSPAAHVLSPGGLTPFELYGYHAVMLVDGYIGTPRLLADGLLRGVPVIAEAAGGANEVLVHGETGMLAHGAESFVDAIAALQDDVDLRRRLIDAAHDVAVREHSWDAFAAAVAVDVASDRGR